jgi:hypothetical protein
MSKKKPKRPKKPNAVGPPLTAEDVKEMERIIRANLGIQPRPDGKYVAFLPKGKP